MSLIQTSFQQTTHIFTITLNRPEMKHAFNTEMAHQIIAATQQAQKLKSRVVIFTSSTDDAFCSGADLKERKNMTDDQWKVQHELFEEMFQSIAQIKCPTISAINGYTLAGGFEIALNTDLIIAGTNTKIGLTEVTRGIMPGGGGARLLPKRIPLHIAKEWLFTGRIVEIDEAEQTGLFNQVVPPVEVLQAAQQLAEYISRNAPLGVQGVKEVSESSYLRFEEAFAIEMNAYTTAVQSQDRLEGISAFNEKRKPIFKGE